MASDSDIPMERNFHKKQSGHCLETFWMAERTDAVGADAPQEVVEVE